MQVGEGPGCGFKMQCKAGEMIKSVSWADWGQVKNI